MRCQHAKPFICVVYRIGFTLVNFIIYLAISEPYTYGQCNKNYLLHYGIIQMGIRRRMETYLGLFAVQNPHQPSIWSVINCNQGTRTSSIHTHGLSAINTRASSGLSSAFIAGFVKLPPQRRSGGLAVSFPASGLPVLGSNLSPRGLLTVRSALGAADHAIILYK